MLNTVVLPVICVLLLLAQHLLTKHMLSTTLLSAGGEGQVFIPATSAFPVLLQSADSSLGTGWTPLVLFLDHSLLLFLPEWG